MISGHNRAGFVGRVHNDGCRLDRWGARRWEQVESGESKMFGAIPTQFSRLLTTPVAHSRIALQETQVLIRPQNLVCRPVRCCCLG